MLILIHAAQRTQTDPCAQAYRGSKQQYGPSHQDPTRGETTPKHGGQESYHAEMEERLGEVVAPAVGSSPRHVTAVLHIVEQFVAPSLVRGTEFEERAVFRVFKGRGPWARILIDDEVVLATQVPE